MKHILFISIAVMMLFRPATPVFEYVLNYDYISKVLCENKSNPEKKCNGKCYLTKNMNKAYGEDRDSSSSPKSVELSEILVSFIEDCNMFRFAYCSKVSANKLYAVRFQIYSFDFSDDFFHPPVAII